jgi:hypothetical protein
VIAIIVIRLTALALIPVTLNTTLAIILQVVKTTRPVKKIAAFGFHLVLPLVVIMLLRAVEECLLAQTQ